MINSASLSDLLAPTIRERKSGSKVQSPVDKPVEKNLNNHNFQRLDKYLSPDCKAHIWSKTQRPSKMGLDVMVWGLRV